jgi:aspartate racemase
MTHTAKKEQSNSDTKAIAQPPQPSAGQETLLAYWKQQLTGVPPVLELPTDHPRPPVRTWRGAMQTLELPKTLSKAIQVLSQQKAASLFTTLLAAFKVLLYRYTGQEDIIIGSPITRGNSVESEELIGLFVNTVVLRTNVSGNLSFHDLLDRVRKVVLEANVHQEVPFKTLVEAMQLEQNLSHHPLFQVMFVFQDASTPTRDLLGQTQSPLEVESVSTTKFDLTLNLKETSQGIRGYFEYNTDLFEAATIARMIGHFQTLLEGIVANPATRLWDLPLLMAAERHQLLVEWNKTQVDYPKDACIHHLFEAQVERTPDAVAVVFEDKQLTYRELNTRANQLAHYLQGLGVKPDVLVAISVERSLEMVVGFLGILKAGGAYVPIDPAYPHERRAYMLKDSQTPVILTQERLLASLPDNDAQVVCLDADWEVIAQQSQENPVSETTAQNLAYIIYTSGSTGKPKGVMIPHQGMVNHSVAIAKQYNLEPSVSVSGAAQEELAGRGSAHRVLQFSSMSFDIIIEELFPSLISGAAVILRTEQMLSSTTSFLQFLERERVTVLNVPTAFWHELVNGLSLVKQPLPTSVRLVVVGGEKASRSAYLTWKQLVGEQIRWLNTYGPTETTVTATLYDPTAAPETDRSRSEIPIGRPIANAQVYVLDQQLQPVPIGVPGELYIGGAGLARGYLNRPDLTANKFIRNPFSDDPNARLYKTGDTVRYLPDGNIEFVGRIDFQVKIRGFRIELMEIEGVLEQHPGVQQAVVLAREDEPGNKRLVGYVVPKPEQAPTISELRSFLKEKLPDYMVPFAFVRLEALPLTPNGKVDRRALPVPDQVRQEHEESFVAPRDELELQLTKIWEQVLGIQPIGIRDNFLEMGGHSLLVMRLLAQINEIFGKNLPLGSFLQALTVEQLANLLRQEGWSAPWRSLVAIQPDGSTPPFFCVHEFSGSIVFCQRLARYLPGQTLYALQPKGLDGEQAPYRRIEDMAAHYIKEIQTVQPCGPYFLGGYSFGGRVALEMAQQLQAQGQKVALLALLDTYGPGYLKPLKRWDWVLYQVKKILQRGPNYILQRMNEKGKPKAKKRQDKAMADVSMIARNLGLDSNNSIDENIIRVMEASWQADADYVPQVYPGRVDLFRSGLERSPEGCYIDPQLGWGNLAEKGLEIHEVPCLHVNMFEEPQIQVLAEKLITCLDKALSAAEVQAKQKVSSNQGTL